MQEGAAKKSRSGAPVPGGGARRGNLGRRGVLKKCYECYFSVIAGSLFRWYFNWCRRKSGARRGRGSRDRRAIPTGDREDGNSKFYGKQEVDET